MRSLKRNLFYLFLIFWGLQLNASIEFTNRSSTIELKLGSSIAHAGDLVGWHQRSVLPYSSLDVLNIDGSLEYSNTPTEFIINNSNAIFRHDEEIRTNSYLIAHNSQAILQNDGDIRANSYLIAHNSNSIFRHDEEIRTNSYLIYHNSNALSYGIKNKLKCFIVWYKEQ